MQGAFTTVQEWLEKLWPKVELDRRTVLTLSCGSFAAFLALKWVGQKRIKNKIQEARRKREMGLRQMEKAVQEFKQQVLTHFPDACVFVIADFNGSQTNSTLFSGAFFPKYMNNSFFWKDCLYSAGPLIEIEYLLLLLFCMLPLYKLFSRKWKFGARNLQDWQMFDAT